MNFTLQAKRKTLLKLLYHKRCDCWSGETGHEGKDKGNKLTLTVGPPQSNRPGKMVQMWELILDCAESPKRNSRGLSNMEVDYKVKANGLPSKGETPEVPTTKSLDGRKRK